MLKLFTCCLSPHCQEQQQQAHSVSITTTERSFFEDIIGSKGGLFRIFRLAELKDATDNFRSRNILGRGAFGEVFKGVLTDGTQVAVKKLSVQSHQGKRQFRTEVTLLSTLRHVNLVRLLGCCAEQSERLLVYEYHLNGSLDQTLFKTGSKNLGWPLRREIIIGAAKGLQYLHEDSRHHIIHRDIKASNILLDEKFHARISDFGLARLLDMSQTHLSTGVAGTFGYLAPEYASSGNLTDKADVYSFGIVMLEVVSGRKNYNPNLRPEDQLLLKVAWRLYTQGELLDLVDRRMGDQYVPWEAARILHVALLCTQAAQSLRPSMSKVVYLLHGRSEISEVPTKPPSFFVESFEMQPHKPQSHKRPSVTLTSSSNASMASSIFSET